MLTKIILVGVYIWKKNIPNAGTIGISVPSSTKNQNILTSTHQTISNCITVNKSVYIV